MRIIIFLGVDEWSTVAQWTTKEMVPSTGMNALCFLVSTNNGSIQQGDDFLDGQPLHSTTYVVVVHVMYNYVPMSRITHVFSVYFMGNCQSHVRI